MFKINWLDVLPKTLYNDMNRKKNVNLFYGYIREGQQTNKLFCNIPYCLQ